MWNTLYNKTRDRIISTKHSSKILIFSVKKNGNSFLRFRLFSKNTHPISWQRAISRETRCWWFRSVKNPGVQRVIATRCPRRSSIKLTRPSPIIYRHWPVHRCKWTWNVAYFPDSRVSRLISERTRCTLTRILTIEARTERTRPRHRQGLRLDRLSAIYRRSTSLRRVWQDPDRRSISSGPRATIFHASWPLVYVSYCAIIFNLLRGILLARAPLLLLTRSAELFRFFSFSRLTTFRNVAFRKGGLDVIAKIVSLG